MTDAEGALLASLTAAALPMAAQIAVATVYLLLYLYWSRTAFRHVDAKARAWLGDRFDVEVVWVRRHTAEYATPFEFRTFRYAVWMWGIADERRRTFTLDAVIYVADLLLVRIAAGAVPVLVLLFLAVTLRALSYVVLLPTLALAIGLYGVYWTGRYVPQRQ